MLADIVLSSQKPLNTCYNTFLFQNKFNRETRVIPVDFSDDLSIYSRLSDELSDLNIGVLGKKGGREGNWARVRG